MVGQVTGRVLNPPVQIIFVTPRFIAALRQATPHRGRARSARCSAAIYRGRPRSTT